MSPELHLTSSRENEDELNATGKVELEINVSHRVEVGPEDHDEMVMNLYSHAATVEIWDLDSQMCFGTAQLPLHSALRQRRPVSIAIYSSV